MRRVICIIICILLLSAQIGATEENTLAQQIDAFISQNDLNAENFALSFFNTITGETYSFNAGKMFPIGEVWTLPLHMYYTLQEHNGAFEPDEKSPEAFDPNYEYTVNGMSLDTCRLESIIEGSKSASEAMRDAVKDYKTVINEEFGHLTETETRGAYYDDDYYSAKFLMNCMLEVVREPEIYGELMRLYDMVPQPNGYFASENSAASKFRTVQLRGEENGYVCAVAELSTATPYVIVGIASQEAGGDALLASLNNTIATYVEGESTTTRQTEPTETQKDHSIYHVNSTVTDKSSVIKTILIAIACAAVLFLIVFMVMRLIRRLRHYR